MKLRLTGRGFEAYTGQMGVIYFRDGLSINDVLPVDGMRIAGTIGATWEDGSSANVGEVYAQNLQTPAPTGLQQERLDYLASVVGITNASQALAQTNLVAQTQFNAGGLNIPNDAPTVINQAITTSSVTTKQGAKLYTREELEVVVDKNGLTGLREIGNELNVKAGSINDLIDRILEVAGQVEAQ